MCTIYENIKLLCDEKGIKPGRMCTDIGISKSILTGLKNGTKKNIQTDTAQKIADYFGASVDRVLGSEQKEKSPTPEGVELSIDELLDRMTEKELLDVIEKSFKRLNKK